MIKISITTLFFMAGLIGFFPGCNAQSNPVKTTTTVTACSYCGKTTCNKTCSAVSDKTKSKTTMQNKTMSSCSLNEKEFSDRANSLSQTIFSKIKSIKPLKDGYDILFDEPQEFSYALMELVNAERNCCSGFTWALVFEPNNNATHLQVYGSKHVKDEIYNAFNSFGLTHLIK